MTYHVPEWKMRHIAFAGISTLSSPKPHSIKTLRLSASLGKLAAITISPTSLSANLTPFKSHGKFEVPQSSPPFERVRRVEAHRFPEGASPHESSSCQLLQPQGLALLGIGGNENAKHCARSKDQYGSNVYTPTT